MNSIKDTLWKSLPHERRVRMDRHFEKMKSEIKYLYNKSDLSLAKAVTKGWSLEIIEIICILALFHFYVVGPFAISGKGFHSHKYGFDHVAHGNFTFDEEVSAKMHEACTAFNRLLVELSLSQEIISSLHVSDILYHINLDVDNESHTE